MSDFSVPLFEETFFTRKHELYCTFCTLDLKKKVLRHPAENKTKKLKQLMNASGAPAGAQLVTSINKTPKEVLHSEQLTRRGS